MQKRGQVTIFLVIGIVVLAIFAATFYIVSYVQKEKLVAEKELPLVLELRPRIRFFVESCLEEVAVPGIYLLGVQGGLIYPEDPTRVLVTENAIINYGYLNGVNQFSLEAMEEDISVYVKESLDFCIDNFSFFQEEAIEIKEVGELKVHSTIGTNDILVNLKYPLEVKLGEDVFEVEDFFSRLPIRLREMVSQANQIIERHEQDPNILDLHYLTTFDTSITTFPFDETIFIYSIYDEKSIINEAPFTFLFAIKDEGINEAPELDFISDFVLTKGINFAYRVTATDREDDALAFSSDSSLIPINSETGLINVTPQATGTYYVKIGVEDKLGQSDEQEVRFVVEE